MNKWKWNKAQYAHELEAVRKNGKYGLGIVNPNPQGQVLRHGRLVRVGCLGVLA